MGMSDSIAQAGLTLVVWGLVPTAVPPGRERMANDACQQSLTLNELGIACSALTAWDKQSPAQQLENHPECVSTFLVRSF